MRLRTLIIALGLTTSPFWLEAQVSKVNYKVQFNEKTNLFDCYMIVKEGSATSARERAQFNAQFTLVVPNGSEVKMVESFMPIQNNQKLDGTTPMNWYIANQNFGPESDPLNDFVSIVPSLSPTSFYNNLAQEDEVKLFSVSITPIVDCGANVRLYEKDQDPGSGARGMSGGDYSNGFTMGSVEQLYVGSKKGITPSIDVIKDLKASVLKNKLMIESNLSLDENYGPYSYVWSGPNDFKAYNKEVSIYNPAFINEGAYVLEVSDNRGCKQMKTIEARINGVIGDNSNESKIEETTVGVYPNPASGFFHLDILAKDGAAVSMELIDNKGGVVIQKSYGAKNKNNHINEVVSTQDLPTGLYNVAVNVDGKITSKQVIILK
jgi:hypothetical protein